MVPIRDEDSLHAAEGEKSEAAGVLYQWWGLELKHETTDKPYTTM